MGDIDNVCQKFISLEAAITSALDVEVREVVESAITEAAIQEVYETYFPRFLSRRDPAFGGGETTASRAGGGITDPQNYNITVSGNELTATDDADWQQLWGGRKPTERLAEAIATGDPRFNMERAGPRPFHDTAKHMAIESGAVERALREGLKRQGIDADEIILKIT